MFDRVDRSQRDGDTIINVKQQPNDAADAARLHGEIRAKALEEVRQATCERFGAFNELVVVKIAAERSMETDKQRIRLIFKLNGHMYDFWLEDSDKGAEESMSIVAQHLVSQVLNKLFMKVRL